MRTNFLIHGKEVNYTTNQHIYKKYEAIQKDAVFYIKSGIIKLEVERSNGKKIELYLKEGDIFGIPEVYANSSRITTAVSKSESQCYVWDKQNFLLTVSIVWELSIFAIKSLSSFTKILNSEFIEKEEIRLI